MADHQRPGDTTRKGYGARHQQLRAQLAPTVALGTVPCARCGYLIAPGEPWDLGHKDGTSKHEYAGPEHRTCNRAAGAAAREVARMADPAPRPMTRW
jgi:hypothetical protein